MTTYAYLRVSTNDQTTENQRKTINDAGFAVSEFHSEDGVSGTIQAAQRPVFGRLLRKLREGDTLIVTMVDRLGRSAVDILNVVEMLKTKGVKVRVLQFDGMDITSSMGKMVFTCMSAMAELERNIISERVTSGLERTKAQGTVLGPPLTIHPETMRQMVIRKAAGASLDMLVADFKIPRNTIARNLRKWKDDLEGYQAEWNIRQMQYNPQEHEAEWKKRVAEHDLEA